MLTRTMIQHLYQSCRGTRFTLSRDELLTLPEFVLLSLFPNGLLPDGHMSSYDGDVYPVDVSTPSASVTQVYSSNSRVVRDIKFALTNDQLYLSDIIYSSIQYDPDSLQYMLEFFRHVAQTIPNSTSPPSESGEQHAEAVPIEPHARFFCAGHASRSSRHHCSPRRSRFLRYPAQERH